MKREICAAVLSLLAVVLLAPPFASASANSVHIIRIDEKDLVPDVAIDSRGIVHMVYGNDHNAYYICSADNGRTFSPPVKINTEGSVETEMGERGPKIALGSGGAIHVVWMDKWRPNVKTAVRYSRSTDDGKTFEPRKTLSSMNGVDGVSLAGDSSGNVLAVWHVMQGEKPVESDATYLFLARSIDNGKTFSHDEPMQVTGLPPLACCMCMMRPRIVDETAYIAFRSAAKNIRDFYVLQSPVKENAYSPLGVNRDQWETKECPMNGPELTITPTSALLCAFMSNHRAYWSISNPGRTAFDLHVATPGKENDEIYPTAAANRAGQVLFLWQVGPMSISDTAKVKWATYTLDGKPTGQQDTIGISSSGTKATAFVGTDDDFYIITSAK